MRNMTLSKRYILTLKSSDRSSVQSKVNILSSSLGEVEIFYGIDGTAMSATEYYKIMVRAGAYIQYGQIITPGEVGTALSHIRILEDFLKFEEPVAIIFEDDVLIGQRSVEMLQMALEFVRPSDILVACDQQGLNLGTIWGKPSGKYSECYVVQKDDWRVVKRACAYAVGRVAAEHILSVQNEGLWACDDFRVLCPDKGRLLFCSAFRHPATHDGSKVENERQLRPGPPAPRSLIFRLRAELIKTGASKSRPLKRAIRSALGGYRVIGQ
jgi:glycosyl transferase family 25